MVGNSGYYHNLWVNTGRSTLEWRMACGSGRFVSDLITGRLPCIEHEDLSIDR